MRNIRFPLPELTRNKFTIFQYKKDDKDLVLQHTFHKDNFYDNGVCSCCGERHTPTCMVEGLPNLCESCYIWMRKYSQLDDPYHLRTAMQKQTLDAEQVKKAIRYAKVKSTEAGVLVGASAITIFMEAYKIYKENVNAGMDQETARQQYEIRRQEEERRRLVQQREEEERRRKQQILAEKIAEKQRILDAQQKRINRIQMAANPTPQVEKKEQILEQQTSQQTAAQTTTATKQQGTQVKVKQGRGKTKKKTKIAWWKILLGIVIFLWKGDLILVFLISMLIIFGLQLIVNILNHSGK